MKTNSLKQMGQFTTSYMRLFIENHLLKNILIFWVSEWVHQSCFFKFRVRSNKYCCKPSKSRKLEYSKTPAHIYNARDVCGYRWSVSWRWPPWRAGNTVSFSTRWTTKARISWEVRSCSRAKFPSSFNQGKAYKMAFRWVRAEDHWSQTQMRKSVI